MNLVPLKSNTTSLTSLSLLTSLLVTPTSALRLPVLGIAGDHDSSTPPDLVRETLDLIPGSEFHLIRGAGHLPCVEKPKQFAELLNQFLRSTGHL